MIKMVAVATNVVVDLQNVGDDVNEDFAAVAAIKLEVLEWVLDIEVEVALYH